MPSGFAPFAHKSLSRPSPQPCGCSSAWFIWSEYGPSVLGSSLCVGVLSSLWPWAEGGGSLGMQGCRAGGYGLETHHRNDFLITPRPELTGPTLEMKLPPPSPASPPHPFPRVRSLHTPTRISGGPAGRDQETEIRERSKGREESGVGRDPTPLGGHAPEVETRKRREKRG